MPKSKDLERRKRIREMRNQGFSLRQIAQMENVSPATVYRALGPAAAPEQLGESHIRSLEGRIRLLEEQTAKSKDFFELLRKCRVSWARPFGTRSQPFSATGLSLWYLSVSQVALRILQSSPSYRAS